ncbi:MFS transporter [Pseudomonas sp. MMS21-TM103]|uniref:MFS transporter n=1 Tax=Pseudomonas sp. MMS21 TM103 TaxID=2886506 RepID=UPI001EDEF382|nr:MFS transporter [Pseudomonas sp. MMS21 TM103]MCG4454945.1 MFS transporter [Pseudomonas sp. MMS21 TM103]
MIHWPSALSALRHRNFCLYFAGHAISTLGTWIQQVALAWLVYRLTGSAAMLGVTTCAALLPQLLIGPLAGAWIDRHDKRRLLILIEGLLGMQALVLALLTATEQIDATLIVSMATLLGVLNAVDTPLRQSLLSQFVDDRSDLPNALALNAMLFTLSRFIGPPLAGLLLAVTGEAACFALNGASYLALMGGLAVMRMPGSPRASGSFRNVLGEGLNYARHTPQIRLLMLSVMVVNLTASSYVVLLPVYAKDLFAGDAATLGWLWGAAGLGSLGSSIVLAVKPTQVSMSRLILGSAIACALAMLAFASSRQLGMSLAALVVLGFGISCCNVGTNILLQSSAPEALRGRVVSLYTSTRFGFDAIGGLLAGLCAAQVGAPPVIAISGGVLLVYCAWLWRRGG